MAMRFFYSALLLLLLSVVACGGKIQGTVCLDGNGNQACDLSENTLTHVALNITKDGQQLAKATTDTFGRFSHKMEMSGYYCVEVDEPYLNQSLVRQLSYGVLPPEAVTSIESAVSLGPTVGSASKQFIPPPASPTPPPTPSATPPQTQPTEPEPATSSAQPDTIESGKVCKNTSDISLTLHVPYLIDYAADLERMPPRLKLEKNSGEVFSVGIPISVGCVLESPLFLPDGLEGLWPADPEEINEFLNIDRETGRIDFRNEVRTTSVNLYLRVRDDLPLGTHSVEIKPVMLCPGDQRHPLPVIPIDLIAKPFVEIYQEVPSASQSPGDEFDWKIFVTNEGSRSHELTVTGRASGPITSVAAESADCHSLGDSRVQCSFELAADQTKELTFEVNLLDIDYEDFASFEAQASVTNYEETFSAEAASVRVAP